MNNMGPDREWQLQITSLVAGVKANQESMHEKLDGYVASSEKRLEDLDHAVYGNGGPGLKEEVRNLKGKWAAIFGIVLLVASAVVNQVVWKLLDFKTPAASVLEETAKR